MRKTRAMFASLALAALAGGCARPAPQEEDRQARPYWPRSEAEQEAFERARRDVFPDDVRRDPAAHAAELLLWSGILKNVEVPAGGRTVHLLVEHHYWDWIEDRGDGLAHPSPRGEGMFECLCEFPSPENAAAFLARPPASGRMIVVYGTPDGLTPEGVVRLHGRHFYTFRPERFPMDVLDYGRDLKPLTPP